MAGKPKSGKTKNANKKNGRPDKYKSEYDRMAYNYCLLGATNEELAKYFDVVVSTITAWINRHQSFSSALKQGRAAADANVSKSLYRRAIGYSHKEEKIFCSEGEVIRADTIKHYPPETVACIFWLKNRRPDLWRDKPKENQTDAEEIKRVVGDLYAQLYNTSGADEKKDSDDTE